MSIDGAWNITIQTPMGPREASLALQTAGDQLSGTFSNQRGSSEIFDAAAHGDDLSFSTDFEGAMGKMKLDFKGSVSGDTLSGDVVFGQFGNGTFTGTRG
jgi:hypothetical protein